jgi:type 1 fimbriae regulatory protein FimB
MNAAMPPVLTTDLRTMQDSLGHRDPKHTAHYTRVAGHRFEGLWR